MDKTRTRRNVRRKRRSLQAGDTRISGVVKKWFAEKHYGFILPNNGASLIFFHYMDVPYHRQKCIGVGDAVFFNVLPGETKGIKAAII